MKLNSLTLKLSMIVFLLPTTFLVKAQTGYTLKFNQVKLIGTAQSVPANTVWKVVSVLGPATTTSSNIGNGGNDAPTLPASHIILVNGLSIAVAAQLSVGGLSQYGSSRLIWFSKETCTSLPLWLPAGTTLEPSTSVNYISVIEFNVIP